MKKLITTTIIFNLFLNGLFGQTIQDTKDFIIEKIDANDPVANYDNFVFFQNILKVDADRLAGRVLSQEEFDNIFIYGRECHYGDNKSGEVWLTVAESVDLRGITKVSTTKINDRVTYYIITVYTSDKYYSKQYKSLAGKSPEWKYLPKMEIMVSDNPEVVEKIKKAIIHLATISGSTVIDGDLF